MDSNNLLQLYITDGKVNYEKLKSDKWIDQQLDVLRNIQVDTLSEKGKLAFWLNCYNIFTLHSVILEFNRNKKYMGNNGLLQKFRFFLWRKHDIGGRRISLYSLENKILRKEFKDPRIHFAINCASNSCPFLPSKLFEENNLDEVLDSLTSNFINHGGNVKVENGIIYLNKIFKWYKKDFNQSGGILPFINKYWNGDPLFGKISFMKYDWNLNSL